MQGDMTEAMKSMDIGMAAAEMELRAARRAVPAALLPEASAPQQLSATPKSKIQLAATAASEASAKSVVQESQDPVVHVQNLDSPQPSAQQQTPTSQTSQQGDHPAPAASGSHDKAEQRRSDETCMSDAAAAAEGGLAASSEAEAGSNAEPAAGGLLRQSSGPAALNAEPLTAQQLQQVQAAPESNVQPHCMKVSKQVTGVQLHIHADSSTGQAAPAQPVSASSSAPQAAASCLPAVQGQTGAADSSGHEVSQTRHANLAASDGSMPEHSCQVHPPVDTLPQAPKVQREAMPCPAGPGSPAESANGNIGGASVSATGQAGSAASAVTSIDCSAVSHQQGAAVEPWAADEGDFADMIEEFLVCLKAMPVFVADHCCCKPMLWCCWLTIMFMVVSVYIKCSDQCVIDAGFGSATEATAAGGCHRYRATNRCSEKMDGGSWRRRPYSYVEHNLDVCQSV